MDRKAVSQMQYLGRPQYTHELREGDLWTVHVVHEPPSISVNRSASNVNTDDHVAEKEPRADERFSA